ncbi:mannan-binding protein [Mycolicibacter heraklionensis]|uniref:mannan-binding protein n=1 Tax=Mycolicibacter heraklionensis TaxID=512402 RepID=UPI000B336277|nr:mannan-binding protein [Mycolicibacter heraklionensis]
MTRSGKTLGALAALLATTSTVLAPKAVASAPAFCDELQANWEGQRCTTLVVSPRKAERYIAFDLPEAMLDDAATGPVLRDFYRRLMSGWRSSGAEAMRDSSAVAYYESLPGPGAVQSLVVHECLEPFGMQANNAYRTFVFDMATGRRLALGDLFKPDVDPMTVIAAAADPVLPAALDAAAPPHAPNTYPFTVEEFAPSSRGSGYTSDYRAFALTPDQLVLYLPDAPLLRENPQPADRFVWSMDGGAVVARVPLASLSPALRPEYGGI